MGDQLQIEWRRVRIGGIVFPTQRGAGALSAVEEASMDQDQTYNHGLFYKSDQLHLEPANQQQITLQAT